MSGTDGLKRLADVLRDLQMGDEVLVAGLTGSVASGKSTLARQLVDRLEPEFRTRTITTDGFLYPNAKLEADGVLNRKGFPETYDEGAMASALRSLREGVAEFPVYDHEIYDIDPEQTFRIEAPDIFILEGLGFSRQTKRGRGAPDLLIYLDAKEKDLETWFLERFMRFMEAAKTDESSFYRRFLHLEGAQLDAFARSVWTEINLPNLREHIRPLRDIADLVVRKDSTHRLELVEDRR